MNDNFLEELVESENKETSPFEILKELTDKEKTDLLSELSEKEIKLITRFLCLCKIINDKYKKEIIEPKFIIKTLLQMRVNKERKGRLEFVEGIKSDKLNDAENRLNAIKKALI